MRDPDVVRTWFVVCGICGSCDCEFDRFIADAGIGIAETL